MKLGLICAGGRELAPFLPHLGAHSITEKAMLTFHLGALEGVQICALYSGVCKVNAAIAAQLLVDSFQVDGIINAGTAGAVSEELAVFDTVVSTECSYHDVAAHILTGFHPWLKTNSFEADKFLLKCARQAADEVSPMHHIRFGKMITGESFISNELRPDLCRRYDSLTTDMETAAIAHVCHVNRIPFIAIRTVTDTARYSGIDAFEQNCAKASSLSKDFTLQLLRQIRQET